MKNLLILATMLLTFGFANAQCRIYSGKYSSGGSPVGYVDGARIYSGKYSSGGTPVGYIDGNRVYSGKYSSGGTPVGYGEGCGQRSLAAAALLLF